MHPYAAYGCIAYCFAVTWQEEMPCFCNVMVGGIKCKTCFGSPRMNLMFFFMAFLRTHFSPQKGGPVTAPGLQKSYCSIVLLLSASNTSMIFSDMFCQSNLPSELHRTFKTLVNNSEMNGFLV